MKRAESNQTSHCGLYLQTDDELRLSTLSASRNNTGSSCSDDEGTFSVLHCSIFPGLRQDCLDTEVNGFLRPMQKNDGEDNVTKAGSGTYTLFSLLCGTEDTLPSLTWFPSSAVKYWPEKTWCSPDLEEGFPDSL
ncbi:protein SMG9 isoform X3 [Scomber scombrus]|uniref:Protein SMG9 isoform X3 n=1 Tax=Scomber scombrus TaxID=13677 RepID=A0AAV1PLG7_SCOSC